MGSALRTRKREKFSLNLDIIPDEVLVLILIRVPAADLVRSVSLVSKRLHGLVELVSVWRRKCIRDGFFVPRIMPELHEHDWKAFYFNRPFTRNFIKNPFGREQFKHWTFDLGGDAIEFYWRVEEGRGNGNRTPIEQFPYPSCFATTYMWCAKEQCIELVKEGCPEWVLDDIRPPIKIIDWYSARFDCGIIYELQVNLLDIQKKVVHSFESGTLTEVQWSDAHWKEISHVFTDYSPGIRYVHFRHRGKDSQFWAGFYGPKITNSTVCFHFDEKQEE